MNEKLQARVNARNRANKIANELYPKLKALFEPWIGKKIQLKDGSLSLKLKEEANKILDSYYKLSPNSIQVYFVCSNYSIYYVVKTSEPLPNYSVTYAETSIYICSTRDQTLEKIYDPQDRRTDFTVEEITEARKQAEDKRKELQSIEAKYAAFGEHDNC